MLLAVATLEIDVHRITVPVRRDTRHKSSGRLIAAIHEMRIAYRRLERLFAEGTQSALLPIRTQ